MSFDAAETACIAELLSRMLAQMQALRADMSVLKEAMLCAEKNLGVVLAEVRALREADQTGE